MKNIRELLSRYLDDRDSLSDADWETLLAELKNAPTLVAELRDQLQLDDYLAQKLAVDRVNFISQVGQRVSDYDRQVAETFDQVAELRSMAEAELLQPKLQPVSAWWSWGTSLGIVAALLLVAVTIGWQTNWGLPTMLAVVETVSGTVEVRSGGKTVPLANGVGLEASQELITGEGSSLVCRYADGTQIRIQANSTARLSRHPDHEGKQIHLDRGALWADIAPQLAGRPMIFVTPHAEATVVGTKFQLIVHEHDTELEVTEGRVDFKRIGVSEAMPVVANEVSHIGGERFEREPIAWPRQSDGDLVFQFKNILDPALARNPESNNLRVTPLLARGEVDLWHGRALALDGGSYWSSDAGTDLLALLREREQITIEVVLGAVEMQDMHPQQAGAVLSFATKGDRGNWSLRTAEGKWLARLRTEAGDAAQELSWKMPATAALHHVAFTYRPGEWKGYCDGELIETRTDVHGNFRNWLEGALVVGADEDEQQAWRGIVCGFAVYRRVLSAEELSQNARHARMVYGPIGL